MNKKKHTLLKLCCFTAASCACLQIINNYISQQAVKKTIFEKNSRKYFSWKLGKIHYTVTGTGSPLLLIHDIHPGSSLNEWKYVINDLSKNHTVYAMDLLGCGCSDRPPITYTNYLYVQLISSFISNVIQEKTDVITSGLSGSIAVMIAKNDNSLINKLFMVNPTDLSILNQTPNFKSQLIQKLFACPFIGTTIYHMLSSKNNIELKFTEQYIYDPFHLDQQLMDSFYESTHLQHSNGKYLLSSLMGNYINFNICHALKTLSNDTYLLFGEKESHANENCSLYITLNSSINFVIFPRTRHFPHLESPRHFLDYVNSVLQ